MADPITLSTIGAWIAANPGPSLAVGTQLVKGLYRLLTPDRARELQMEVLESQKRFRDRLARQSFGDFTAAERQQIRRASAPGVNKIASGVAQRGLGTSGAGAQIIAEAQQAPFLAAQQTATQALSGANTALLGGVKDLVDDGSFFDDLLAISKELEKFKDPKEETETNGTNGDDSQKLTDAVKTLYKTLFGVAGPAPGMPPQRAGQGYVRQQGGWL